MGVNASGVKHSPRGGAVMGGDVMDSKLRICQGKDCKKHRKRLVKLAEEVSDICPHDRVKCQDICKGPVVVMLHGEHRYWFKQMKGDKVRRHFRAWLPGAPMSSRLEDRLGKRRSR